MKFLAYLICYLIYPFSFLFPRSKRKYVFGSYRGSFADNAKYLFIYSVENADKNIRYIWLSTSRATVAILDCLHIGFSAPVAFGMPSPQSTGFSIHIHRILCFAFQVVHAASTFGTAWV